MADNEGGEKTEQPTAHKLSKAREQGQSPKSQEITSAFVLIMAGSALVIMGPKGWDRLVGMFRYFIWRMAEFDPGTTDFWPWVQTAFREVLFLVIPIALVVMVVGVSVNIYQLGGFVVNAEALTPKFGKLFNIVGGLSKFFKVKSLVDAAKNILKIVIIFYVAYRVIRDRLDVFVVMSEMEPVEIALVTLKVAAELFYKICLTLIILGFLDFSYQKWDFMRDMRMTKQEVKDEFKQMDGDPQIKAKIRAIQREKAKQRMLTNVPKADVVVTNPTHFAIALVYNSALAQAPLVLAKGQDFMAQRIKDIAREAKVPIVENKPLAQALYKAVEVGEVIPLEFYKAVAEVLSYVYKLKGKVPGGRRR